MEQVADPHELEDVDVAIVRGDFAVAENGAVWLTDAELKHRAILFITQHLVLVVPRDQIVDNMHQAYERLRFDGRGYGLFLSGPSKTADIEQSLVIGAHGPPLADSLSPWRNWMTRPISATTITARRREYDDRWLLRDF